jgi:hypothetical protein
MIRGPKQSRLPALCIRSKAAPQKEKNFQDVLLNIVQIADGRHLNSSRFNGISSRLNVILTCPIA